MLAGHLSVPPLPTVLLWANPPWDMVAISLQSASALSSTYNPPCIPEFLTHLCFTKPSFFSLYLRSYLSSLTPWPQVDCCRLLRALQMKALLAECGEGKQARIQSNPQNLWSALCISTAFQQSWHVLASSAPPCGWLCWAFASSVCASRVQGQGSGRWFVRERIVPATVGGGTGGPVMLLQYYIFHEGKCKEGHGKSITTPRCFKVKYLQSGRACFGYFGTTVHWCLCAENRAFVPWRKGQGDSSWHFDRGFSLCSQVCSDRQPRPHSSDLPGDGAIAILTFFLRPQRLPH